MGKHKTFRNLIPIQAAENGEPPAELELLQTGEWNTPWHGHFVIDADDLAEYVEHAREGVRKAFPIDLEHNTIGGAVGWLGEGKGFDFEVRDNDKGGQSLWASVDWTKKGKQLIADREYRFFSPEFQPEDYEDPEHAGQFMDNVLFGGGLTNRPLFKGLTPVAASDSTENGGKRLTGGHGADILYLSEELQNMDLQALLAKNTDELTAEEKAFIVEHKSELTEDQTKSLTDAGVLEAEKEDEDENEDETAEQKAEREKQEQEQADADAKAKADQEAADAEAAAKEAKEKGQVSISASELEQLKADAKAGRQASDTLGKKASEEHVTGKLFNEKEGLKMPIVAKDSVTDFYHTLNSTQRKQFNEIVDKLPTLKMFNEQGKTGGIAEGSAADTVMKKAHEKLAEAKKAGEEITLGQAKTQVLKGDKELKARYDEERGEQ